MRGSREHGRQAARHGHAAVEALELGRDLALVVVHREHAVELVAEGLEEHGVGREGPLHAMPRAAACATAGAMMSISSRPKRPFSPPWGLSAATAMRGLAIPGAAHGAVGERERLVDALGRDLVERGSQRHVRGHARHPLVVEHVHLAEKPLVLREVREHLVLVVEFPAAGVQRRLVERREHDAVEAPGERQLDHVGERLAGDLPRFRRHRAARDRRRIEIAQVDDRDLVARPLHVFGCRHSVRQSIVTPASRAPWSSTRASPITSSRAASDRRPSASTRAHCSGPMPV